MGLLRQLEIGLMRRARNHGRMLAKVAFLKANGGGYMLCGSEESANRIVETYGGRLHRYEAEPAAQMTILKDELNNERDFEIVFHPARYAWAVYFEGD